MFHEVNEGFGIIYAVKTTLKSTDEVSERKSRQLPEQTRR